MATSNNKKVLIIGLDGFTWTLGDAFMREGIMPNLAKLVASGGHGLLQSVTPYETGPAWSSFQTGCHPGKTGVFAFHNYDRTDKAVRLNSFNDIKVPSLWELADQAGKCVISINMPVNSPPPQVKNGVMIPGLLCPALSPKTVYPSDLYEKYIKPRPDYCIVNKAPQETTRLAAQAAAHTEIVRIDMALEIMEDYDWDICSVQMQSTDAFQHKMWWLLKETENEALKAERADAILFYREIDKQVGRLLAAAGDDVLTLIVSDHGFTAGYDSFGINTWLKQKGYLTLLPQATPALTSWQKTKQKVPGLKAVAKVVGLVLQKLATTSDEKLYCETVIHHLRNLIDNDQTEALCLGGMGGVIYINGSLKQREVLRQKIKSELLEAFGPNSATPVIASVAFAQDTYDAVDWVAHMPDLSVVLVEGVECRIDPVGDEVIMRKPLDGTHALNGIWVAAGREVSSLQDTTFSLVDIMPTVLAYCGIDIPEHVDGQVMQALFKTPLAVQKYTFNIKGKAQVAYTDQEQKDVENHLSDLGYM